MKAMVPALDLSNRLIAESDPKLRDLMPYALDHGYNN